MFSLEGIIPPLPTSFDHHEELLPGKMQQNIKRLADYGLAGFLVLGSNGEQVNLTEKERRMVCEKSREAIPDGKVMLAGTGCQSTRATIRASRDAARAGADGVLVLNPSYYRGLMSREALVAHYRKVADASEVPVVVYNMPANSGLDMDAQTITEIAVHDNIVGLKDSAGNLVKMGTIIQQAPHGFQVMAGSAGFLLPALSIGATGGILALANIAPAACLAVRQRFLEGRIEEARRIQLEMIPLNTAVTRQWGVPALKEAMDYMGLYGGPSRSPLMAVSSETRECLHHMLNERNLQL